MRTIRYYLYKDYPLHFRQFNQACELEIKSRKDKIVIRLKQSNNIVSALRISLLNHGFLTVNCISIFLILCGLFAFFAIYSLIGKVLVIAFFYFTFMVFLILLFCFTPKIQFRYHKAVNRYKNNYNLDNARAIKNLKLTIKDIKNKTLIPYILFVSHWGLLCPFLVKNFVELINHPVPWNNLFKEIYNLLTLNFITTNSFGTLFLISFTIVGIVYFFRRLCPIVWLEQAVSTLETMDNSVSYRN